MKTTPAIRAGVCDALRLAGHTPLEAADGDAGLRVALENEVDLVLLDVVMPKQDGIAVLAQIRKERLTLPVIMLTARGTEADRVREPVRRRGRLCGEAFFPARTARPRGRGPAPQPRARASRRSLGLRQRCSGGSGKPAPA